MGGGHGSGEIHIYFLVVSPSRSFSVNQAPMLEMRLAKRKTQHDWGISSISHEVPLPKSMVQQSIFETSVLITTLLISCA